ncbi:MAG: bifunctional [glutamine synthetase] adenylyltransferase/[glutamine synthetase]-adenylyl-L-tyrosine phosphorylase [Micrococcales bacterium]|nr:bifunctional [glutamine synthetase] adenylyltransferase/[glutamine synthetase]-adenylyl-L-tyrosine phosphorylase [Micrococcales bacterium]
MSETTLVHRGSSRPATWLARLGFEDGRRALALVQSPALNGLSDLEDDETGLLRALAYTADPIQALLGVVRMLEAIDRSEQVSDLSGTVALRGMLDHHSPERDRLLAVLGASSALGDHLARQPGHWPAAAYAEPVPGPERANRLVAAVSPQGRGECTAQDALRIAYREQLLGIAALDLRADDAAEALPETARALAELASAALEAGLAIAVEEHPRAAARARLAVIGMGKCGGNELNYISDVDVIFVAEPAEAADGDASTERASEVDCIAAATQLATTLMRACSAATAQGTLWPVDAALRPEGKQGPLVRTVSSHAEYYKRWAKTWEFQALLKARCVAGDVHVGQAYLDAVMPMVWEAAGRKNFVEDVQAMRRRVEQHVPSKEAERQLKLGAGGLRDVEFAVQLLQLVHGRSDESLRSETTLVALGALSDGGYVGRDDAARMDTAYRFLRTLEHRIQLWRMRRTHLMPTTQTDLRRLGRSVGLRTEPDVEVVQKWREHKREVRRIHERLFYRPLLSAAARLSADDARLTPQAARERLLALGFGDPAGALRHLEALTAGSSRTAAIQRTLLPVMLGWFADEADPDAGLLAFRKLSDSLGGTHWYLKMLRDEGLAAERLAHVLARSRYAAELLMRAPESVRMLAEDEGLHPRTREQVLGTMRSAMARRDDADSALEAVRVIRREELFRISLADLVGAIDETRVQSALTDLTEALLECVLHIATKRVGIERGAPVPTDIALIGMGRLGGGECGYGSDADLIVVHAPHEGTEEPEALQVATAVLLELRKLVGQAGPDPSLEVDLDLRPEGKAGPVARTIEGYAGYYRRWSVTWEAQALVRARAVAGDVELGAQFVELINPLRYPDGGLEPAAVKEIRRLKARMESERLPRGADPKRHFKLGRGGLSDVEWTIQLLQMQHAHDHPTLRTTSTLEALRAAKAAGLIAAADASYLEEAWRFASDLRNAMVLWRVRGADSVPEDLRDAEGAHRILGGGPGQGAQLVEHYRRVARHARDVTERVFYGRPTGGESYPVAQSGPRSRGGSSGRRPSTQTTTRSGP